MPAYRDKERNTWYSSFKYKDIGVVKQKVRLKEVLPLKKKHRIGNTNLN